MSLTCHWQVISQTEGSLTTKNRDHIPRSVERSCPKHCSASQLVPFFWIIGNSAMSFSADAPFPSIDLRLQEDPPPRRLNVGQMYLGSGIKLLAHFNMKVS
jgi:hypothetical protein